MSNLCSHGFRPQDSHPSASWPPQAESHQNNMVSRDQAIHLLQELITKASVRLHDAMRKQPSPVQSASPTSPTAGHVSKAATVQQMQMLLDRLGSEAYKELEQQLGFKIDADRSTTQLVPSHSDEASPPMAKSFETGSRLEGQQQNTDRQLLDNFLVDAGISDEQIRAKRTGAQPLQPAADNETLRHTGDARKLMNSSYVNNRVPSALHGTHNVHPAQHTEYLGASRRAGSPSRPACFDVYQGYRQRGASRNTHLNLPECETGVTVFWVPGGKHQGTFNKYGAVQAAAGINRKTCSGTRTKAVKLWSPSAHMRCSDKVRSRQDVYCSKESHSFPLASDALSGSSRLCTPEWRKQRQFHNSLLSVAQHLAHSADTLDSPQARLSFDLKASRLVDPTFKGCTGANKSSFSTPQRGQTPLPLVDAAAPVHRRRWPEQDSPSLTIDDQQQGTQRMVSPTATITETVQSDLGSVEACSSMAPAAPVSLAASPPNIDFAAGGQSQVQGPVDSGPEAPDRQMSICCSVDQNPLVGQQSSATSKTQKVLSNEHGQAADKQPLPDCGSQRVMKLMAPRKPQEVETAGSIDWRGIAATAVPEMTPVEPPVSSVRSREHFPVAPRDTVEIPVATACQRSKTTFQGDNQVRNGLICASSDLHLDREKTPNAALPTHDNVTKVCKVDSQCGVALGPESVTTLTAESISCRAGRTASLEAPGGTVNDCNSRMRQHLDKAYRIVNHLNKSAELMQKLHCTSPIPADVLDGEASVEASQNCVLPSYWLGSTDVHSQAMEPMNEDQTASACAATSSQHIHTSVDAAARHAKKRITTDRPDCTGFSRLCLAHAATCSGIGTPELPCYLSCQPTCTIQPDIGRSRSLNSSATRVPRKIRPSDAIVNRVDEIHRSVERLKQVHLSATRSCDSINNGHAIRQS